MVRTLPLLLALAAPAVVAAQGKLEAVRDEVDKPQSEDKSQSDNRSRGDSGDDSGSCPDGGLLPALLGGAGSAGLFGNDLRFTDYPYARPGERYLVEKGPRADFVGRASVEAGSDFDGLHRLGLRLFLETDFRLGLKTDWDYYTERLACGCRDELWLGDLTATYRVVEVPEMLIHLGAGARWLLDRDDTWAGLNLYSGFEFFPKAPVHVFGSLEAGSLGAAGFYRARGGAGWHWSRGEVFAGYDFVRIGGVRLQGPFLGLRVWF